MKTQEQFDKLMQRPDLDEAKERYDKVQQKVRSALRDEFDLPDWEMGGGDDSSDSYCSDFPDVDGLDAGNYHWAGRVAEGSVVPQWDEVRNLVQEIASEYGFAEVTLDTGSGDHRAFELSDGYGATLYVGSKGNTVVSVSTGCHLTQKAKQRGRPITETEVEEELWGDQDASTGPSAESDDAGR